MESCLTSQQEGRERESLREGKPHHCYKAPSSLFLQVESLISSFLNSQWEEYGGNLCRSFPTHVFSSFQYI